MPFIGRHENLDPLVTALLTLNTAQILTMEGIESLKGVAPEEMVIAEPVTKAVSGRFNASIVNWRTLKQSAKFRVLEREFTIEQGELPPTMTIRRGRVMENHRALVSELYLGKEEMD